MSDPRPTDPAIARRYIQEDRFGAHALLFADSHDAEPSPAHEDLIDCFWSPIQRGVILGFRGFAKSTTAEEHSAIAACEGAFNHLLYAGPSETRASEHLEAIRSYLESNDTITLAYGDQKGHPWSNTRAVTKQKRAMTAIGVGQSIRGIKYLTHKPDLVIVDDFEDEDNVLTPEGRKKMLRWFLRTLRLACHPQAKVRVLATLMDADSVPAQLIREAGWPAWKFPICYLDDKGEERATWPARFPMEWVRREREEYRRLGDEAGWDLEMMCDASKETGARDFKPEYFKVEPIVRTWQPVYAVFDPARTKSSTSASTGIVVFSWIGQKLVVWEDRTGFYLPSEMIDIMFEIEERYQPVAIGFEKNGLEEWAFTLIRAESLKRGISLPLRPLAAPRDKLGFIRGLEAYARLDQLVFAGEFPILREQFLNFPRGRIDGPNALAYAQTLRPGVPIYDNFTAESIELDLAINQWKPVFLVANARDSWTSAALVQMVDGRAFVLADWCFLGAPEEHIGTIADEANLLGASRRWATAPTPTGWDSLKAPENIPVQVRRELTWVLPANHWDRWVNVGLEQAVRRLPARPMRGGDLSEGRQWIKNSLSRMRRSQAAISVSQGASWTLRALSGGYCRDAKSMEAEPGPYRCLVEGLESWAGLMQLGHDEEDAEAHFAYDRAGRRYNSMIPVRH